MMNKERVNKKGYIGPFQLGGLSAFSEVVNKAGVITGQKVTNLENVFYAGSFQSGVERFLVLPSLRDKSRLSDFIKERMSPLADKNVWRDFWMVEKEFSVNLPSGYKDKKEYSGVVETKYFLQDMIIAMRSKSSLLIVFDVPKAEELGSVMPTSLLVPIRNLLSGMRHEEVSVPVPRVVISEDNIKRYQEILNSGIFNNYSKAQEELEHSSNNITKALGNVVSAGKIVFGSNDTLINLQNIAVGILTVTPRIIETVFGRLPGALSEFACKAGLGMMNENRNLVVYNFNPFLEDIVLTELKQKRITSGMQVKIIEHLNKIINEDT